MVDQQIINLDKRMNKAIKTLLALFCCIQLHGQDPSALADLIKKLETAADTAKPDIYNQIASFYLFQEKYDSALFYTEQSIALCKKTGNEKGIADAYNQSGIIYRTSSDNEKAMQFYLKALAIYEKEKLYRKAARTLGNLSGIYSDQLKYEEAFQNVFKALDYAKKVNDTITLISLYGTGSYYYIQVKDFTHAKDFIDRSDSLLQVKMVQPGLSARETAEMTHQRININYMKASLYSGEGKFAEAVGIYHKELEADSSMMGTQSLFDGFKGLSENYLLLKQYDKALLYSDMALTVLRTDSIPYLYMDIYALRAKIFAEMGQYENAYRSHMLLKATSDSIVTSENFKTVSNLQIRYETEKKEQQINQLNSEKKAQRRLILLAVATALIAIAFMVFAFRSRTLQRKLFKQKEELLNKEKQIETSELQNRMYELEQMALRAQMNPHFIFNSLNSVQHFVMKQDVEGVNKYLSTFAHLVRQTLDNSGKPLVSLDEEIRYLEAYLSLEKMKSNDRFTYTIDVDKSIDRHTTFIPGMILQPFVENSIRHGVAHKEKNDGQINVNISKNGNLVCEVTDNGIGRRKASEISSAAGTSGYESKGMGITMKRIDTINKIYNTDIVLQVKDINGPGGQPAGTRVAIEFPPDLE